MLHVASAELGCRLVVVLGAQSQIDNYLSMRGLQRHMVGGYRVTDENAMLAAMEAAGTARMLVEAQLSKVSFACPSPANLAYQTIANPERCIFPHTSQHHMK